MKKLLPKFNKTSFILFAQDGSKTKTTKVEEEELPEEEIEIYEEINQPIPVVVAPPPKSGPVYGLSSPVVGSYGFDPTLQPWSTLFNEEDKANYKEVPNNKDAGKYVSEEDAVNDGSYISAARRRVTSTLNELQSYWNGPVAKHRLKYISGNNTEEESFDETDVEEKIRRVNDITARVSPYSSTEAYPGQDKITINPYLDGFHRNMGAGIAGSTSHEVAHMLYDPYDMENESFKFSPEYIAALNKISPGNLKTSNGQLGVKNPIYAPYAGKKYYLNSRTPDESVFTFDENGNYQYISGLKAPSNLDKFMETWVKATHNHDSDINEKIPFIYETREALRKSGMWDYTTGEPLTKKTLNAFKAKFPNTRLLNYTDDDNALWLLNVTAQNNTENTSYNMA